MMTYALKGQRSTADEPKSIPVLEPLIEVRLAATNSKRAKNCQLRRLDGEELTILFTAAFRPFGKREVLLSQMNLQALYALLFGNRLLIQKEKLKYVELTYSGDIPNEASYAFTFARTWCGTRCIIFVRCDDFITAITELKK